jgi:DNA repair exonuclease SbcCD ATPase subunit
MSEPSELESLQCQKLREEIKKLDVETRLLTRSWWQQASYIAAILPIVVVSFSAWVAYSNSEFKREAEAAKADIAKLRPEAETLKAQVSRLQKEEPILQADRSHLLAEVQKLQHQASTLQKRNAAFNQNISKWRSQLMDISTSLKSMTPSVVNWPNISSADCRP